MNLLRMLLAAIVFAIGAALCVSAYSQWQAQSDFAAHAVRLDGVVVELSPRGNSGASVPIVEAKAPDGSIIHVSGSLDADASTLAKGDHVSVLYDPLQLGRTRFDDSDSRWRKILLLGVPGFIALLVGGYLIRRQTRQQRAASQNTNK